MKTLECNFKQQEGTDDFLDKTFIYKTPKESIFG